MTTTRRQFLSQAMVGTAALAAGSTTVLAADRSSPTPSLRASDLPQGNAPAPVPLPHFPSRLHAFVWRNWSLVPLDRMARVVGTKPDELRRIGRALGLPRPPRITRDLQRRAALTIIRRNWHLLPYEQLLALLDWSPDQLAYTLREDDFLYIKLGSLKPRCEPIRATAPTAATLAAEAAIGRIVREHFPDGAGVTHEPLFSFVAALSSNPRAARSAPRPTRGPASNAGAPIAPRFCYSYFALYGDPLLDREADPYPDGYLARLAASGVDGVWLQGVLYKLASFPWEPARSDRWEERLRTLGALVARARRQGIGLWLYLNEPRAMPLAFFEKRPELKGVVEGDYAALCTSVPAVQDYLRTSVASICRAVPDLAGFFTITGSENFTHCWSHGAGSRCERCAKRGAAEVIAELNGLIFEGIREAWKTPAPGVMAHSATQPPAGEGPRLLAWDWGWADAWVPEIVKRLPTQISLMSVSEWSIPIRRGGVETTVGEYSISTIGPGPRATRHWDWARQRGLRTIAKIQAGNTWELSAVPYIPAVENVAQHAVNLRSAGVNGLMLGWTLGGYPSPNLEVVAALATQTAGDPLTPDQAMRQVAERRFGPALAEHIVRTWRAFSTAFREFPYHGGVVYNAPLQCGPSNLLWAEPTGYQATMVGFPYDDLDGWRQVYPPHVFAGQFETMADGFDLALSELRTAAGRLASELTQDQRAALSLEMSVGTACALHFRSVAHQTRFIEARRALATARSRAEAEPALAGIEHVLRAELEVARRLHALQCLDSRLGFEASNQYFYVPLDLGEKVLNCRDLLDRWLPAQKHRWA